MKVNEKNTGFFRGDSEQGVVCGAFHSYLHSPTRIFIAAIQYGIEQSHEFPGKADILHLLANNN